MRQINVGVIGLKHPDIGMTMYRFDSGAIAVNENNWALPARSPMQIDERMEIVGTTGSISIHDTTLLANSWENARRSRRWRRAWTVWRMRAVNLYGP